MNTISERPEAATTVTAVPETSRRTPEPYWNPYIAGMGLGLVLLAAFVVMGRGLGASSAFQSLVATGVEAVASEHARQSEYYSEYLGDPSQSPLLDWTVFEILGVFVGGFLSGTLAGRVMPVTEKGPRISTRGRMLYAFLGGGFIGIGARLARGCMSGQALTGGALLNVGSWVAMMAIFGGAYAVAWFMRRQWQ